MLGQFFHKLGNQGFVMGNPLQAGIGKEQVIASGQIFRAAHCKIKIAVSLLCLADHIGRSVDSQYFCIGENVPQDSRTVAGTAANIRNLLGAAVPHTVCKVNGRLCTLLFE